MNEIKGKVTDALFLDSEKSYKEAYSMYLKSTAAIVENLQLDFDGIGVSGESSKLLRLGQQCLERMTDLITQLHFYKTRPKASLLSSPLSPDNKVTTFPPTTPNNTSSQPQADAGLPHLPDVPTFEPTSRRRTKSHPVSPSVHRVEPGDDPTMGGDLPVLPDVPGEEKPRDNGRFKELPSVPTVTSPRHPTGPGVLGVTSPTVTAKAQSLSPVEAARLHNQRLLAAYRTRLASSQTNKGQAATINLNLQRRLAENVAVAKAREESLLKKQKDRNRRLQEQAARSLHSTVGMSQDELERRQFYYNVLQFENNSKALLSWRERLKAKPGDVGQIQTLITYLLSVKRHPFTQMLHKYQYTTYNRILPLIDKYASQFDTQSSSSISSSYVGHDNNNATTDGVAIYTKQSRTRTQSAEVDSLHSYSLSSSQMGTPETMTGFHAFPHDSSQSPASCDGLSVISNNDTVSLDSKDEGVSDVNLTETEKEDVTCTQDMGGSGSGSIISISPGSETFEVISPSEHKEITYIGRIEVLEKEALQRHLDNIVADVHEYLDKLRSLLAVVYEDLDTPEGKDVCYSSLEAPFFKPMWGYITALYRIVHKDNEDDLKRVFKTHRHFTPADMGVGEKYCLDDGLPSPYSYPYQPAVNELRKITQCTSPLTKLECIVKSSRTICSCVEEHFTRWDNQQSVNIGADDLLPILSYVILKSDVSLLVAESHALEEFIDEGYLMGEEGYCLTSLQTALGFVLTLVEESATEP